MARETIFVPRGSTLKDQEAAGILATGEKVTSARICGKHPLAGVVVDFWRQRGKDRFWFSFSIPRAIGSIVVMGPYPNEEAVADAAAAKLRFKPAQIRKL